jgi:glycosyltransferase involved in cell wall biosynthesis
MRINLVGQIYGCMGIPNHTRDLFREICFLDRAKEVKVYPLNPNRDPYDISPELDERIVYGNWQDTERLTGITFIFWTPDIYPQILRNVVREDSIVIGYPIFEWTSFTKAFRDSLDTMDYIAVSSAWAKNTLISNGVLDSKIIVLPAGVNNVYRDSSNYPRDLSHKGNQFLFIAKNEKRKCVKECLENFHKAFPNGEQVLDVLLTDPHTPNFDAQKTINELVGPEIGKTFNLIGRLGKISEMVTLYKTHRYILVPSRAGGTELPMIEAACCGTLPIATNYGGMANYLPKDYLYHIPVKTMVPMYDDRWYKPSIDWGSWAEPDWNAFRELLKDAASISDREFNTRSTEMARVIRSTWNYAAIVSKLLGFFDAKYKQAKLPRTPKTSSSSQG